MTPNMVVNKFLVGVSLVLEALTKSLILYVVATAKIGRLDYMKIHAKINNHLFPVLLTLCICFTSFAGAQDISTGQATSSTPPSATSTPIATTVAVTESQDIAQRINEIFAEINALSSIQVKVSAGVVTLSGTVPNGNYVKQAERIALRVAGVVTVQNDLERDLDISTNLTPTLSEFKAVMRSLLQALPLLGVSLAIGTLIITFGYLLASFDRLWRWIMPNIFMAEIAGTFVRFLAIVLGLIAVLQVIGATALLSGVLGGAGIVGIALGFAARDMAGNYVASLMLSLRQPFRANDLVVIEGYEGRVIRLTSRATVLMTLDGNHLRIPNLIVFKSVILNYTINSKRRYSFDLGVDAADDPIDGMYIGLKAMNSLKFVLVEPAATAVIENVGDSNVVLRFYGWIDQTDTDFLKGRSLAIQATKLALEDAGFALPEPIYRLRFDEDMTGSIPKTKVVANTDLEQRKSKARIEGSEKDARPDKHIELLVATERANSDGNDLLDSSKPIE